MPRYLWIACAIGLLLCLVLALWGRASSGHVLVLVGTVGGFVSLAALLATLHLVLRRRKPAIGRCAAGLLVIALFVLFSLPIGATLLRMDVKAARSFCDDLTKRLESARIERGAYPASVTGLLRPDEDLPRLLQNHQFYVSDGEFFVISFDERNGVYPDEHVLESESGRWSTR